MMTTYIHPSEIGMYCRYACPIIETLPPAAASRDRFRKAAISGKGYKVMAIGARSSLCGSLINNPIKLKEDSGLGVHFSKSDSTDIIGVTGNQADFDMGILGSFDAVVPINKAQGYFTNSNPVSHSLDSAIDVYDQDH